MSVRFRLVGAFTILLAALAGLGAWNAWRLSDMGAVSSRIIADNYDSVVAAQEMKESLERFRDQPPTGDPRARFAAALERAAGNITEPGEREVIAAIARTFAEPNPDIDRLRLECNHLLTLNQEAMRLKAATAAEISRYNVVTSVSLAVVLTVLGLVVAVLISGSLLRPIGRLTTATAAVAAGDLDVTVPATGGREIGRLAAAFNDMAGKLREVRDSNLGELMRARQVLLENVNQLKELDRLKSAFVAAASHELRTPLMSFQMGVHLLQEDAGNLTARQRELLLLCRSESDRLVRLSSELLDLSKIESGEAAPRLARMPIARLLTGAIEPIRVQVEAHDIALVVATPAGLPDVMADRTQIERVIANLVTNAVRATPSGGCITVGAALAGSRVAVTVADNGHGIPAEYLDRIFVPFIQVPGPPAGGAGLGLAISRRIVEGHGGEMTVRSAPGHGATFTFTLTVAPGEAAI
jgi:signal transduction histidine kinase